MKIWYARVSTRGQSLSTQVEKLEQTWCEKIYQEKITGTSRVKRQELENALDYVRRGDVLYITKLDRLARSVHDLTQIVSTLQRKEVGFIVLDQDIDTTTSTGRLLFHMISAIWEFERDLINERTAEGIAKAKANGVKFWAKPKLTEQQIRQLKKDFQEWAIKKSELARMYGINRSSVYRIVNTSYLS